MVYAEANWSVHSLTNKINFFLDYCTIQQGARQVTIVKNNCYAGGVGVSNLSPGKIVDEKSRFRNSY